MLAPNKSQAISPIALSPVSGSSGSYVQTVIVEEVKKAVLDAALNNPELLVAQQMDFKESLKTGYRGIFGGTKGSPAQQEVFDRIFSGLLAKDIVKADGKLTPIAQEYFKDYLPKQKPPKFFSWQAPNFVPTESRKPAKQMMEGMRLMAGSYMLGGLTNLGSGQTWE